MATTTTMSGAAFDQLPYEEGRRLELLDGEVIEVPRPTPTHQLTVGMLNRSLLDYFVRSQTGVALADCEFVIGEDLRLCPDVAVLLQDRWSAIDPDKTPILVAPDIAVEVISPSERAGDTDRKIWRYLDAGTREVWEVRPESRRILIYRGAKSITVLTIGDSLTTPLLPEWEMPVSEIFRAY